MGMAAASHDAAHGVRLQFATIEFHAAKLPQSVRQRWQEYKHSNEVMRGGRDAAPPPAAPRGVARPRRGWSNLRPSPAMQGQKQRAQAAAEELGRLQVGPLPQRALRVLPPTPPLPPAACCHACA
jgi:hypothetical protein